MTRKKKIVIWIVVIAALLGGFLALRIPSWTRTYGLSQEVLAGDRVPTAEETIRLYFYYCNRMDWDKTSALITDTDRTETKWWSNLEACLNWFFLDDELFSVHASTYETYEKAEEATRMLATVEEAHGVLRVTPLTEKESNCYYMVREDVNSPWKIDEIGTG